jgi:hypothetical protein
LVHPGRLRLVWDSVGSVSPALYAAIGKQALSLSLLDHSYGLEQPAPCPVVRLVHQRVEFDCCVLHGVTRIVSF